MSQTSPVTATLVHEWQAEAKKHALAALDGDCEVGDDEWCLHRESARIYRKCADQLEAILTAGHAQTPAVPASIEEIAQMIGIEFRNDPWAARRAAERVYNFLDARISVRAKTLARQATTSGLPHCEGQAVECDGGLRTVSDTSTDRPAPACKTCRGHGLVGGFVFPDQGYDSAPCPDCSQSSPDERASK